MRDALSAWRTKLRYPVGLVTSAPLRAGRTLWEISSLSCRHLLRAAFVPCGIDKIAGSPPLRAVCGLGAEQRHNKLKRLQLWLSTNAKLPKPELPSFHGSLTIADVSGIDGSVNYGRAVESWARSAWEAYKKFQPIAREWLAMSAVQSASGS